MTRKNRAALIASLGEEPTPLRDELKRLMPDLEVHADGEDYDRRSVAYALVWHPPRGLMASLPNLEVIFSLGAGIDHILADPDLPQRQPIVRLMHDATREQVRDYVLHVILHYYRMMDVAAAQQLRKHWEFLRIRSKASLTVGILGLGEMGGVAARALVDLGFQVAGWSRSPRNMQGVDCYSGPDGLAAMLKRTNFLVSLLPGTKNTVGILNKDLFAQLPKGAIVVNLGRGNHLVIPDLLAALDSGHLGGATIDVFSPEPLAEDSPVWAHPLIRVTPHIGSDGNAEIAADAIIANIRRVEKGEAPTPIGDRTRGY